MKRSTKLSHKKMMANILHCYLDAEPAQIKSGMSWYADAYNAAYQIGLKYDVAVYIVVVWHKLCPKRLSCCSEMKK